MRRSLVAILIILGTSGGAVADTIRVRSGEHPGFSRLVLDFAQRPDWSVQTSGETTQILLSPSGQAFDTSQVFSRIPRTRIREVTASEVGLTLTLACACRVAVFETRDNGLAIDVADALPGDQLVGVEQTSATEQRADAPEEASSPVLEGVDAAPVMPPPRIASDAPGRIVPAPVAVADRLDVRPASLPILAPDPLPVADKAPMQLSTTLDRLAEGVARAASQGTLRLAPGNSAELPPGAGGAPIGVAPGGNLRLRVPGEEDWLSEDPIVRSHCIPQQKLNVAAWSSPDAEPAEQIATARRQLADAADGLNEERSLDLARLFTSLGFGAEARAVIAALAPRHPDSDVLIALTHVVDGELPSPGILDNQTDCPGRSQLWLSLAGTPGVPEDVLVAVSELQLPLRRHLSARLIAIFLEAGDRATADAVRASVERAAGPHGDAFDLAAARLDAADQRAYGLRTVSGLAQSASPVADEALAVHLSIGNGGGPAPEQPALARAEIRADDLRGTDTGSRIETELIMAALRMDDFDLAGSRLSNALSSGLLPLDNADALVEEYVRALAHRASDETVLVHAAAMMQMIEPRAAGGPARAELAQRLADLGFARLARAYLPVDDEGVSNVALKAQILLLAGDALGALALLEGETPDDRTLALRASALRALDRTDEAAALYELVGDRQTAEELRRLAAVPAGLPGAGTEDDASDASLPRLVSSSEAARNGVAALLRSLPQP